MYTNILVTVTPVLGVKVKKNKNFNYSSQSRYILHCSLSDSEVLAR